MVGDRQFEAAHGLPPQTPLFHVKTACFGGVLAQQFASHIAYRLTAQPGLNGPKSAPCLLPHAFSRTPLGNQHRTPPLCMAWIRPEHEHDMNTVCTTCNACVTNTNQRCCITPPQAARHNRQNLMAEPPKQSEAGCSIHPVAYTHRCADKSVLCWHMDGCGGLTGHVQAGT